MGKKSVINSRSYRSLVLFYFSGLLVCLCSPTHKSRSQCCGVISCHFPNLPLFSFSFLCLKCLSRSDKYLVSKVQVKTLSCARLLQPCGPIAYQAPPPWDFPGESTGVGCHCLSRDRPNPGMQPGSPLGRLCSRSHQEIPSLLEDSSKWHLFYFDTLRLSQGFSTCRLSYFEMYLHLIDCNVQSSLWQRFCFTHLLESPGFSTLREKNIHYKICFFSVCDYLKLIISKKTVYRRAVETVKSSCCKRHLDL